MFENWLDTLQRGTYDLPLPTLTINREASLQCHGSGWLTWRQEIGLELRATTDGAAALLGAFGEDHPLGALIPHDSYITASGETQDQWHVELAPVPLDGYGIHGPSPHVVWNLNSHGLTLTRPARHPSKTRVLRGLFGPSPETWVRGTQTEVHHPDFGRRSGTLDWLEVTTSVGRLVARRRSAEWFEVAVYLNDESLSSGAFDILSAVARAFGFALGRRVYLRGYEDLAPEADTRYLYAEPIRPTRGHLQQPLARSDTYRASIETLLQPAIDYFLTACGIQVARYLHLCWDVADNDIQTRMTVASVSVEGLLLLAAEDTQPHDPGFTAGDLEAARQWLRDNAATLSPRFVERLRGLLGTLNHRRPIDVLQDWRRRGVLDVTADDVEAWRQLRNATTHAQLIEPGGDREHLQERLDYLRLVVNLLNRIVLMLIGYSGQYTNYAADGWPVTLFPLPAPGSL